MEHSVLLQILNLMLLVVIMMVMHELMMMMLMMMRMRMGMRMMIMLVLVAEMIIPTLVDLNHQKIPVPLMLVTSPQKGSWPCSPRGKSFFAGPSIEICLDRSLVHGDAPQQIVALVLGGAARERVPEKG